MVDVTIIIVNYNTKQLLGDCIQSIYEKTFDVNFEIIIVDNASNDGSQGFIRKNFPKIVLIESEFNLGFGLANNLGAKSAKGNSLFFLNSDTVLFENSIKILIDFFKINEKKLNIGVLGAVLVDEKHTINGFGSHFPTCTEENTINLRKIPIVKWFVSIPQRQSYNFENCCFEVDYVIGADMLLRKELFDKMNGFSKEFFMYYEESDLQKRIANLGLKRYIITNTKIIHLEDGSGKVIQKYSNRKRTIVHKSRNIYLRRNDEENFSKFASIDFIILILNFLNFKYSFKENFSYFREILKTY